MSERHKRHQRRKRADLQAYYKLDIPLTAFKVGTAVRHIETGNEAVVVEEPFKRDYMPIRVDPDRLYMKVRSAGKGRFHTVPVNAYAPIDMVVF